MAYRSEQPIGPEGDRPEGMPPSQAPEPPKVPEPPEPSGASSMRSIQTLITVSMIAGPVSLIIGGVLLSLVAIACAIVALAKTRRLQLPDGMDGSLLQTMQRQAMVGIGIGVVALGFNAVSLAMIMPAIMEAAQTGDLSSLLGGSSGSEGAGPAASGSEGSPKSSVWG